MKLWKHLHNVGKTCKTRYSCCGGSGRSSGRSRDSGDGGGGNGSGSGRGRSRDGGGGDCGSGSDRDCVPVVVVNGLLLTSVY